VESGTDDDLVAVTAKLGAVLVDVGAAENYGAVFDVNGHAETPVSIRAVKPCGVITVGIRVFFF
jgi:hypothetical protein